MAEYHVRISYEAERGCGYRKPGGLYLVSGKPAGPCGKLPLPLSSCPTCGQGIKPARGWAWVGAQKLFAGLECPTGGLECSTCPLRKPPERAGLLWIGEQYYRYPAAFTREAAVQGISRRISAVPKDFMVGETLVLLAHRKTPLGPEGTEPGPAVFGAFRPERIEYVVKQDDPPAKLQRMVDRGISLVDVRPQQTELMR